MESSDIISIQAYFREASSYHEKTGTWNCVATQQATELCKSRSFTYIQIKEITGSQYWAKKVASK